jgi:hypothetical protein
MSLHRNATPHCSIVFTLFLFGLFAFAAGDVGHAAEPSAGADAAKAPPDVIVFTNGDQLSGTFVREIGGTVTFHSDIVGDINIDWDKIKELRTQTKLAVLNKSIISSKKHIPPNVPEGTITETGDMITVHPNNNATIPPIPVKDAAFIIDETTMQKQLIGEPGFFGGWNGAATGGATIVKATQNQETFNGTVALVRVVPTASWLNPRNRTSIDFTGSYGKITEKAYISDGMFFPATNIKTALYHAGAERDWFFSPRWYALAQAGFDHNFSQGLDLQQLYGGGIGWTAIKKPKQQLDLIATLQYVRQNFLNAAPGTNEDLIGSTFGLTYLLKLPRGMVFNQQAAYLPSWNVPRAYSITESNSLVLPAYKNLGFSVGTLNSYLNNPPPAVPPTKRNSFQFIVGATYAIKSKY